MISGILITAYNDMSGSYTCSRLIEESAKLGMSLRTVGVLDTCTDGNRIVNPALPDSELDFSINRYKWGHVKDILNAKVRRSYNDAALFGRYVDKYNQYSDIKCDCFHKPRTLIGRTSVPFGTLADEIGIPFVAKGLDRSCGEEIILVDSEERCQSLNEMYGNDKEWLFQQFISSSYGRDLRVFSIRGEVIASMIRRNDSDFRSNYALGSKLKKCDAGDDVKDIIRSIYGQTGLDFMGVDLLFGEDGYYLCEINVMPGLKGVESVSGINVARRCMETIRSDLKEHP